MSETTSGLQQQILALGATLVGFADMEGVLEGEFACWPRAISIALAFPDEVIAPIAKGPTLEYYRAYNQFNERLNEIAAQTAKLVRSLGYRAESFPATVDGPDLDIRSLSAAFHHKTAATRAGLGWVGRSALLVSYKCGPRVRFVTVFTDMPLAAGTPVTVSECEDCRVCVRACPGEAIHDEEWWAGRPREDFFDAHACFVEASRQLRERVGVNHPVCGICIAVCPQGRPKASERSHPLRRRD
ncbi:MAG: epoxyqueuosine reductase [Dehalococcoidia bacterium]|nr:MAG: epoxyqueuosine reductase [Dehalococcoidia bacterium]